MKSFTIMTNKINPIHYVPACSMVINYTAMNACTTRGVT